MPAVLGYCRVCERLVALAPGGHKQEGGRERHWHPVDHVDDAGKPCPGTRKGI